MTRVVIAPDKFKGVLSARDVANAMAEGVRRVAIVTDMAQRGMEGTEDEMYEVVQYLTKYIRAGQAQPKVNVNKATVKEIVTGLAISAKDADAIALMWVLHDWKSREARTILRHCYEALRPGGVILIGEKLLDEDRAGPAFTALMNLHLLVSTGGEEMLLPPPPF